jgi:hypothetical protein
MSNLSTTPPNSKGTPTGSLGSKTTPLKRDLSGSQTHTSTPEGRASTRYKDMARDACEKFVGPMPVDEFLLEFVPEATEVRPADEIMFPAHSVSQNEDDFVSHPTPNVLVFMFTAVTDSCN